MNTLGRLLAAGDHVRAPGSDSITKDASTHAGADFRSLLAASEATLAPLPTGAAAPAAAVPIRPIVDEQAMQLPSDVPDPESPKAPATVLALPPSSATPSMGSPDPRAPWVSRPSAVAPPQVAPLGSAAAVPEVPEAGLWTSPDGPASEGPLSGYEEPVRSPGLDSDAAVVFPRDEAPPAPLARAACAPTTEPAGSPPAAAAPTAQARTAWSKPSVTPSLPSSLGTKQSPATPAPTPPKVIAVGPSRKDAKPTETTAPSAPTPLSPPVTRASAKADNPPKASDPGMAPPRTLTVGPRERDFTPDAPPPTAAPMDPSTYQLQQEATASSSGEAVLLQATAPTSTAAPPALAPTAQEGPSPASTPPAPALSLSGEAVAQPQDALAPAVAAWPGPSSSPPDSPRATYAAGARTPSTGASKTGDHQAARATDDRVGPRLQPAPREQNEDVRGAMPTATDRATPPPPTDPKVAQANRAHAQATSGVSDPPSHTTGPKPPASKPDDEEASVEQAPPGGATSPTVVSAQPQTVPAVVAPASTTVSAPSDGALTGVSRMATDHTEAGVTPRPGAAAEAATSAQNQSVLRHVAQGEIDHPELGHVEVTARTRDGEIDVRVIAQRADTTAILGPHAGAIAGEVRAARGEVGRIDIGTGSGATSQSSTPSGGSGDRPSNRRPGHEASEDEMDIAAQVEPGRVRIVL